jgi:type IV secretion system protein VirB9
MLFFSISANAAVEPTETRNDPRIKQIIFSPDDVVELKTHYFRYTMIEFAEHESYVTHYIGDPDAWDFNVENHRLFIKPIMDTPNSNMTVITDKRVYFFKLIGQKKNERKVSGDTETYALRFKYPKEKTLALERKAEAIAQLENQTIIPGHTIDPDKLNHDYGYKGEDSLKPVQVFDDGVFTYFQFGEHQTIPAIFFVDNVIGGKNREQLVNFHHRGNYLVVERVGVQFALRVDNSLICVFNKKLYDKDA